MQRPIPFASLPPDLSPDAAVPLLATAIVLLVLFLAAACGAVATLAQNLWTVRLAFWQLRRYHQGRAEMRTVEALTEERCRRSVLRHGQVQSQTASTGTWPSVRLGSLVPPPPVVQSASPVAQPQSDAPDWDDERPATDRWPSPPELKPLLWRDPALDTTALAVPASAQPPPLPDPTAPTLGAEEMAREMARGSMTAVEVPMPMPLVQPAREKSTAVWAHRLPAPIDKER